MRREATAPVPRREGAGRARGRGADLRTCWHAPGPRPPPQHTLLSTCPGVVNTQVQDVWRGVRLEKNRRALPSHPSGHSPRRRPLPGRGPHPALGALHSPRRSRPALITAVNTGQRPPRGRGLFGSGLKTVSPWGWVPRSPGLCHCWVGGVGTPEAPGQARLRLEFRLFGLQSLRKEISRLVGLKPRRYLSTHPSSEARNPSTRPLRSRRWRAPRLLPGSQVPGWPLRTFPVPPPKACALEVTGEEATGPGGCGGANGRPEASAFLRLASKENCLKKKKKKISGS